MLVKAILTGGVLSVLAGVGVYYGSEGAGALEAEKRVETRVEETDLAGAADVAVGRIEETETGEVASDVEVVAEVEAVAEVEDASVDEAGVQDPPRETSKSQSKPQTKPQTKPKTKWLDQYLKKSMPGAKSDAEAEAQVEPDAIIETEVEPEVQLEAKEDEAADAMSKSHADGRTRKRIRIKQRFKDDGSKATATGSYVVSKESRSDTQDRVAIDIDAIDLDALNLDAFNLDGDIDIQALKEQLGLDGEKNVQIRVIKKVEGKASERKPQMETRKVIDYDAVLVEAKKLLVTDMKNQAVLEIVDYAVDNGDMAQATNLLEELSTPELRDTARARIGTGFARCGDAAAAFAVLDALEIDELSAPIRLEIITSLMATRQERKAMGSHR